MNSQQLAVIMSKPVAAPSREGLFYTPVFKVSFPHLDAPWAGDGSDTTNKPAYSLLAVFADDADLGPLMAETRRQLTRKFGDDAWGTVQYGSYRIPLRPKIVMAARYAGFEGTGLFGSLRAQETAPPKCLRFENGEAIEIPQGQIENHLYAGSYAYATLQIFPYANVGKGVGWSLRTLVKVADGERLGGPKPTTSDEAQAAARAGMALLPDLSGDAGPPTLDGTATETAVALPGADVTMPWATAPQAAGGAATAPAGAARKKSRKEIGEDLMDVFG